MKLKCAPNSEMRLLMLAPSLKDATLTESILEDAGIECQCCIDLRDLSAELRSGAGAILLPEEAATSEGDEQIVQWLNEQPAWSDLPVLILARPGADSTAVAQAMDLLGNVTVLERPMRISSLVSATRSALRARQRQYQIRDQILKQEESQRELREADRRKDEFLAVLAHELRNPLSPIRHALSILRIQGTLKPEAEELRGMIERQVDHMVRLVDDLLEVSRITSGKIELRKEVADVSQIIASAIETSRPIIDEKGHKLTLSLPNQPMSVIGDPVRLAQIFSNLLTNAAKYTDAHGSIFLEAVQVEDWIKVTVQDNGTGISSDMLPRVFDMFAQVDRNTLRSQGGLGIGLTLVKSLVEMHGGSVEVTSEGLGTGCRFVVTLPCGPVESTTQETEGENDASTFTQRCLVVDDNQDAANVLATLLRLFGADAKVAFSGTEALKLLEQYKPTVAILDIGMPDMSGHELARRIRELPQHTNITLIALSGWGQVGDREQSKASGFNHHLVKPVDIKVLQELLGAV